MNATRIIRSIHLYLARSFVPSRARHVVDAKKRAPERGCLGCRDDVARDDRTARRRADAGDDGDARTSGEEASAVSGPGRGRTVERGEINARKEERSNATAPTPATRGRRNTMRGRDASGADEDEEPLEVVHGGSTVNAYEMTNMVKSELVAEFERRGEKLIELERETIELRQKTANAESLHAAVKAEVETLRELKSEHEKSKNAMRDELAEERQANMLALEREVERACDAESRAKTLALELAQVKEERVKLEASIDRERANDSAEEAAEILDLSEKTAELEYAVAQHLDEISNLKRENMSLKTSLQRTEAERDEATERVEQSEEAVRSCEGLVAVAEASMIEMRKELGDAATSMSPTQTTPEIEELRATNKVLQEELRIATKEAAEVKTLRRKSEFAATCEERAMARRGSERFAPRRVSSRRLLCRRDCPNSSISKTIGLQSSSA